MTLSHKFVVIFAFAFRILVVVFSCFRLFYMLTLPSPTDPMSDITFHSMSIAIFTHLTLCTSLIVSCVPFLKSVMENLQSGLFANHGQHGLFANGGSGMSPSGSYAMKNLSKSGKSITKASRNGTQVSQAGSVQSKVIKVKRAQPMLDDEEIDMGEGLRGRDERLLIEVMKSVEVTEGRQEDEESLNSLSGSERRILGRSHRTMVEAGRDANPSRNGA